MALLVALLLTATPSWADSAGFEPLPGARQLETASETGRFEFITSAVERRDRTLFVERSVRVVGTRTRLLIELPGGTDVDESLAHYEAQFDGTTLFSCSKRACGRSNIWANTVFEEPRLYGADREQRYVAIAQPQRLASFYTASRGTRRAYLHIELIELNETLDLDADAGLQSRLAEVGFSVVRGVAPLPDGTLSPAAVQRLNTLGTRLADLRAVDVYVVCHLYSDSRREALLQPSETCAASAAQALSSGYEAAASDAVPQNNRERATKARFVGFGAGALLPRDGDLTSRLELVVPARLWRD